MKLSLLGATGRVGSQFVKLALQNNHEVQALVRNPEKLTINNHNLTLIQGNAVDEADLNKTIAGTNVVVSALNTDNSTVLSESIPLVVKAMKNHGVSRLITIGTAGILNSKYEPGKLRYQSKESKRKSTTAAIEHEKVYRFLEQTDVNWTIVCPTYLPDGPSTGTFRIETDVLPVNGHKISTGDTALFTYQLLHNDHYHQKRVGIAY